jgi:hypothetical protein
MNLAKIAFLAIDMEIDSMIHSNYAKWKWSAKFCCDGIVTTIVIYANG